MKKVKIGCVAFVIVLLNNINGYTNSNELSRRLSTEPPSIYEETKINVSEVQYSRQKPIDLFLSMDIDKNRLLEKAELEEAKENKTITAISKILKKDSNLDGNVSLEEYFNTSNEKGVKEMPQERAMNPFAAYISDFIYLGALGTLIIVIAGIKINRSKVGF